MSALQPCIGRPERNARWMSQPGTDDSLERVTNPPSYTAAEPFSPPAPTMLLLTSPHAQPRCQVQKHGLYNTMHAA
jgi:hypothetical protein